MACDKYNGWTNYETWNVKLWMDNDEGSYHHYGELAQDCFESAAADEHFTHAENAVFLLAERLKSDHEEAMQDLLDNDKMGASMWADLLGAALSEVNWHEIAEHMIEDVDQDAE